MRRCTIAPNRVSIACCCRVTGHERFQLLRHQVHTFDVVPQTIFQQDKVNRRDAVAAAEEGAGLQQANSLFPAAIRDVGAFGRASSCWRSWNISSNTASGSLILPICCCHWVNSSSLTCSALGTGLLFSSCWLTSIERKLPLSCTLSSHRRISIRSYSASGCCRLPGVRSTRPPAGALGFSLHARHCGSDVR